MINPNPRSTTYPSFNAISRFSPKPMLHAAWEISKIQTPAREIYHSASRYNVSCYSTPEPIMNIIT
jgi:hypothetical protein